MRSERRFLKCSWGVKVEGGPRRVKTRSTQRRLRTLSSGTRGRPWLLPAPLSGLLCSLF